MPRAPSMTSAVRSGSGRVIPADDGLGGALRNTRDASRACRGTLWLRGRHRGRQARSYRSARHLRPAMSAKPLIRGVGELPAVSGAPPKVRFASDSPLEGDGFEPSVPP
jgi:hypothetical protein